MATTDRSPGNAEKKRIVDFATILGIFSAFALVIIAMATGSGIGVFVDLPSVLIVGGGTFGVILASYSFKDVLAALMQSGQTVSRTTKGYGKVCYQLIQLAQLSRTKGVLILQGYVDSFRGSSLMTMGIIMLTDGMAVAEIEAVLSREAISIQTQKNRVILMLRKAAEVAPAMGLIGTLVGLVQMLGKLENPDSIGPAMAVALLTTFYGAILASLVFSPLANKLEQIAEEDEILNQLYLIAVSSMAKHENPRRLEILMNTVLPPQQRVKFFD